MPPSVHCCKRKINASRFGSSAATGWQPAELAEAVRVRGHWHAVAHAREPCRGELKPRLPALPVVADDFVVVVDGAVWRDRRVVPAVVQNQLPTPRERKGFKIRIRRVASPSLGGGETGLCRLVALIDQTAVLRSNGVFVAPDIPCRRRIPLPNAVHQTRAPA